METTYDTKPPVADAAVHLQRGIIDLIKDESKLFLLEGSHIVKSMKADAILTIACATLCVLSVLPLLASAVIGLGWLMDGSYGWSALIVGTVCAIAGGLGMMAFAKRLTKKDFSFSHSREALQGGHHDFASLH